MNLIYDWREAPKGDFAVIGDPVKHSKSPAMHMAAYQELGLPYQYVAVWVVTGEVALALDHLRELGYRGVNVTVPHKEECMNWLSSFDDFSRRVRAVNTINLTQRSGTNTDGPGFLDTLQIFNTSTADPVLMLGAGGAARAIVHALHEAGYAVEIYNRTASRLSEMESLLGYPLAAGDPQDISRYSLIVNATSAGISGEAIPVRWSTVREGAVAYDLFYQDEPTAFLNSASEYGLQTIDGKPLLVAQGARSFEWWLEMSAPRSAMLKAIS